VPVLPQVCSVAVYVPSVGVVRVGCHRADAVLMQYSTDWPHCTKLGPTTSEVAIVGHRMSSKGAGHTLAVTATLLHPQHRGFDERRVTLTFVRNVRGLILSDPLGPGVTRTLSRDPGPVGGLAL
jgi:hypothetical protein